VICDLDADPKSGPAAYRVERHGDDVIETRLAPGPIA
jgi:hypothetical protein